MKRRLASYMLQLGDNAKDFYPFLIPISFCTHNTQGDGKKKREKFSCCCSNLRRLRGMGCTDWAAVSLPSGGHFRSYRFSTLSVSIPLLLDGQQSPLN